MADHKAERHKFYKSLQSQTPADYCEFVTERLGYCGQPRDADVHETPARCSECGYREFLEEISADVEGKLTCLDEEETEDEQ
jgi:hypothetical protein